jgi:hypothetical protein
MWGGHLQDKSGTCALVVLFASLKKNNIAKIIVIKLGFV